MNFGKAAFNILLSSIIFLTCIACTNGVNSPEATINDRKDILDQKIPVWLEAYSVPGVSVAYIENGEIAWSRTYGQQNASTPINNETLFNAASLTKPVAAEVVLRLASKGLLSLDEPMAPHWIDPDIADDPRHKMLTPRMVLTHQTGFKNWRKQTNGLLQFEWAPGSHTGYSGEGFQYLVRFVEAKLGRSFEELAEELIFIPLDMKNSALTKQDWFGDRLAWRYYPDSSWREPRTIDETNGADQLRTTSVDYARFVTSVMKDKGLNNELASQRKLISRNQLVSRCLERESNPDACPLRMGFGLSWYVHEYEEETIISHGGANTGLRSVAIFVPERNIGLTVFANGENGNYVIFEIVDILLGNNSFVEIARPSKPFKVQ